MYALGRADLPLNLGLYSRFQSRRDGADSIVYSWAMCDYF